MVQAFVIASGEKIPPCPGLGMNYSIDQPGRISVGDPVYAVVNEDLNLFWWHLYNVVE